MLPALGPRSTVGVVSLASCVDAAACARAATALRALSGWQVESLAGCAAARGRLRRNVHARARRRSDGDVAARRCGCHCLRTRRLRLQLSVPLLDFEATESGARKPLSDTATIPRCCSRSIAPASSRSTAPWSPVTLPAGSADAAFISAPRSRGDAAGFSLCRRYRTCNRSLRGEAQGSHHRRLPLGGGDLAGNTVGD